VTETRKLAAILVSDVVGYSRPAGADEDRILARLRALRSDLIDPTIAVHNGRVVIGSFSSLLTKAAMSRVSASPPKATVDFQNLFGREGPTAEMPAFKKSFLGS
jgi:class 3 adenylate cyclase